MNTTGKIIDGNWKKFFKSSCNHITLFHPCTLSHVFFTFNWNSTGWEKGRELGQMCPNSQDFCNNFHNTNVVMQDTTSVWTWKNTCIKDQRLINNIQTNKNIENCTNTYRVFWIPYPLPGLLNYELYKI